MIRRVLIIYQYYFTFNNRGISSFEDEVRVKMQSERKKTVYESRANTIKAVVAEYCRDVNKTEAPVFQFRQHQDNNRPMFLAQAILTLKDGTVLTGTSEKFQYTKKAAEKLAALGLCLKLIELQQLVLTQNIVNEVNAFVKEGMIIGPSLRKTIDNVLTEQGVKFDHPIQSLDGCAPLQVAASTDAQVSRVPVSPIATHTTSSSPRVSPVGVSGTKRRAEGNPQLPSMEGVSVHCKACDAMLCPVNHLALIHPHISIRYSN